MTSFSINNSCPHCANRLKSNILEKKLCWPQFVASSYSIHAFANVFVNVKTRSYKLSPIHAVMCPILDPPVNLCLNITRNFLHKFCSKFNIVFLTKFSQGIVKCYICIKNITLSLNVQVMTTAQHQQ